jgi:hypothetical protein
VKVSVEVLLLHQTRCRHKNAQASAMISKEEDHTNIKSQKDYNLTLYLCISDLKQLLLPNPTSKRQLLPALQGTNPIYSLLYGFYNRFPKELVPGNQLVLFQRFMDK